MSTMFSPRIQKNLQISAANSTFFIRVNKFIHALIKFRYYLSISKLYKHKDKQLLCDPNPQNLSGKGRKIQKQGQTWLHSLFEAWRMLQINTFLCLSKCFLSPPPHPSWATGYTLGDSIYTSKVTDMHISQLEVRWCFFSSSSYGVGIIGVHRHTQFRWHWDLIQGFANARQAFY